MAEIVYCGQCGARIAASVRFCTSCGTDQERFGYSAMGREDKQGGSTPAVVPRSPSAVPAKKPHTTRINLFRYHDLAQRLAVFSTEGGLHLGGETEDVQVDPEEGEVALRDGEGELARFGGAVRIVGPRTTSASDDAASLGLVLEGAGALLVTTQRLILMATRGSSQLGAIGEREIHTFALPWDLVDSVAIADKRSLADRVAGARTIEIFGATTGILVTLIPVKQREINGRVERVSDEEVMRFLARAGATHRLSVSPPGDRERLQAIIDGRFELSDGDRVAVLSQEHPGGDLPAHLEGRVVEVTDGDGAGAYGDEVAAHKRRLSAAVLLSDGVSHRPLRRR